MAFTCCAAKAWPHTASNLTENTTFLSIPTCASCAMHTMNALWGVANGFIENLSKSCFSVVPNPPVMAECVSFMPALLFQVASQVILPFYSLVICVTTLPAHIIAFRLKLHCKQWCKHGNCLRGHKCGCPGWLVWNIAGSYLQGKITIFLPHSLLTMNKPCAESSLKTAFLGFSKNITKIYPG